MYIYKYIGSCIACTYVPSLILPLRVAKTVAAMAEAMIAQTEFQTY